MTGPLTNSVDMHKIYEKAMRLRCQENGPSVRLRCSKLWQLFLFYIYINNIDS